MLDSASETKAEGEGTGERKEGKKGEEARKGRERGKGKWEPTASAASTFRRPSYEKNRECDTRIGTHL